MRLTPSLAVIILTSSIVVTINCDGISSGRSILNYRRSSRHHQNDRLVRFSLTRHRLTSIVSWVTSHVSPQQQYFDDHADGQRRRAEIPILIPRGGGGETEGSVNESSTLLNTTSSTEENSSLLDESSPHEQVQQNLQRDNSNVTKPKDTISQQQQRRIIDQESSNTTTTRRRKRDVIKEKLKQTISDIIMTDNYNNNNHNISSQSTASHRRHGRRHHHRKDFLLRKQFFDKMVLISSALLKSENATVETAGSRSSGTTTTTTHDDGDGTVEDGSHDNDTDDNAITRQSDLNVPGRNIWVVTTAALPWMTGTAVNPLLRAGYLCRKMREINSHKASNVSSNNGTTTVVTIDNVNDTMIAVTSPRGGSRTNVSMTMRSEEDDDDDETTSSPPPSPRVTLVVPWLELEEDRRELYGDDTLFTNEEEQEVYIRTWMREKADLVEEADPEYGLRIAFYPARYHAGLKSIFAMGDICSLIPDEEADVCILEEPEHLNWYRAPGSGWTTKFSYVIGIVHTNYVKYASSHYSGLWTAPAIGLMSSAMVRAYCHKVIKLSDVLQPYATEKEQTSNVHGVRREFLDEGKRRALLLSSSTSDDDLVSDDDSVAPSCSNTTLGDDDDASFSPNNNNKWDSSMNATTTQSYFIGKILWAKGLNRMIELEEYYRQITGDYFPINIYGSGPELKEIKRAFHGRTWANSSEKILLKKSSSVIGGDGSRDDELADETTSMLDDIASRDFSDDDDDNDDSDNEELSFANITKNHFVKISQTIKSSLADVVEPPFITLDLPKSIHEWRRNPIPALFPGRVDHSLLTQYKIFINPSVTEVLCTTTAEALAMGKFAIIPVHPSNAFFMQFPNCLSYRTKMEFAAQLRWAMLNDPTPMRKEELREFSWEAATERFIKAAGITKREAKMREKLGRRKLDERIAWFHGQLGQGKKGDALRKVLGGGPVSDQVKYQLAKAAEQEEENRRRMMMKEGVGGVDGMNGDLEDDEDEEDEDEINFLDKLRGSTLAEAIRTTLSGVFPPNINGDHANV